MKLLLNFNEIDKTLILGASGCGKSYLGRLIQQNYKRLLIFDILDEYEVKPENTIRSFDEFVEKMRIIDRDKLPNFKYVVKFSIDDDDEYISNFLNNALKIVFFIGNMTIVIEEIQHYCSPHLIPKYLKNCMLMGRHKKLSFICTSQRPALINKTILSQSTHIFSGRLADKNDLSYVSNFLGNDSKDLASLKKCNFIWFNPQAENSITKISTI